MLLNLLICLSKVIYATISIRYFGLLNGKTTLVGYLMPKPFLQKKK